MSGLSSTSKSLLPLVSTYTWPVTTPLDGVGPVTSVAVGKGVFVGGIVDVAGFCVGDTVAVGVDCTVDDGMGVAVAVGKGVFVGVVVDIGEPGVGEIVAVGVGCDVDDGTNVAVGWQRCPRWHNCGCCWFLGRGNCGSW